jgi:AcrR family transcriptional regulator
MTTRTPNIKDRRVQRTHQKLRQAFLALILERGYHAVTIRDVVQRAGVGRSTFYIHFGDLEELMMSHGDGQWLGRFGTPGSKAGQLFAFSRPFLEHANEQRRLWRALVGNKGGVAIRKHFKEGLIELVRRDVARAAGKQHPKIIEGMARYFTGAYAELLFWWLDSPSGLTPADVDDIFQQLTARALGINRTVTGWGTRR